MIRYIQKIFALIFWIGAVGLKSHLVIIVFVATS
jgi:hypothetical protein